MDVQAGVDNSPGTISLPASIHFTEGDGSPANVAVKVRGEPTGKDTTFGVKVMTLGGKDTGPSNARPPSLFSDAEGIGGIRVID